MKKSIVIAFAAAFAAGAMSYSLPALACGTEHEVEQPKQVDLTVAELENLAATQEAEAQSALAQADTLIAQASQLRMHAQRMMGMRRSRLMTRARSLEAQAVAFRNIAADGMARAQELRARAMSMQHVVVGI
jgi:hypothetical protein